MSHIKRGLDELDFYLNINLSTQHGLPRPRPLLHRRSSSVALFAKPSATDGHVSLASDSMMGNVFDTTIHQSHELGAASSEIEVCDKLSVNWLSCS